MGLPGPWAGVWVQMRLVRASEATIPTVPGTLLVSLVPDQLSPWELRFTIFLVSVSKKRPVSVRAASP